jgi:hypothetical protein
MPRSLPPLSPMKGKKQGKKGEKKKTFPPLTSRFLNQIVSPS